jgi:hypothetical protein
MKMHHEMVGFFDDNKCRVERTKRQGEAALTFSFCCKGENTIDQEKRRREVDFIPTMADDSMQKILDDVEAIQSIEENILFPLEKLVDDYFEHKQAGDFLDVWFRLYERCEDNSNGIFMTILHRIETYPKSNHLVVESLQRKESRFPLMMLRRLMNGGIAEVDGVDLQELYELICFSDIGFN